MRSLTKTTCTLWLFGALAVLATQSADAFELQCFNSSGFRRTPGNSYPISTLWARSRWTEADLVATSPNAINHIGTATGPGCNPVCVGTPGVWPITGDIAERGEMQTILYPNSVGPYSLFVTAFLTYFVPDSGYVEIGRRLECVVSGTVRPGPPNTGGPRVP